MQKIQRQKHQLSLLCAGFKVGAAKYLRTNDTRHRFTSACIHHSVTLLSGQTDAMGEALSASQEYWNCPDELRIQDSIIYKVN